MIDRYHSILSTLSSRHVLSDFPREVRLETINSCNATCSFCAMNIFSQESKSRKVVRMDERLVTKILDELVDVGFDGRLKFYTENEPLLDKKRLPGFVREARDKLPEVEVIQVDTNGTLLTEELGVELITAGINYLVINDYTETGGGGLNFKKTSIKSIYDALRLRFPEVTLIYRSRLVHEVLDNRAGHSPNNPADPEQPLKAGCVFPFYQFCITSNGNVGLCCVDTVFEEPLGNITTQSIASVWQGHAYRQLREELLKGQRRKKLCSKCTFCGHLSLSGRLDNSAVYNILASPIALHVAVRDTLRGPLRDRYRALVGRLSGRPRMVPRE